MTSVNGGSGVSMNVWLSVVMCITLIDGYGIRPSKH